MLQATLEAAGVEFIEENGSGTGVRLRKGMKPGIRPLERAFQLAQSGSVRDVAELKRAVEREGYSPREIEGKVIRGQLRELIKAARAAGRPEPRSI